MPKPPLVEPPAAQMNARRIVALCTLAWFVASVVLLVSWHWVDAHGHRDWLWTSLAGWPLGLLGYAQMARHRRMGRTI